jgi:hypothetical protein
MKNELGDKCLVDTVKVYNKIDEEINKEISIVVEMDGIQWESTEYATLEEFLQSIINRTYKVAMGEE